MIEQTRREHHTLPRQNGPQRRQMDDGYHWLNVTHFPLHFSHPELQENFSTSRTKVEELSRLELGQAGQGTSSSSRTTGYLSHSARSDHGCSDPCGDGMLPFDKGSRVEEAP